MRKKRNQVIYDAAGLISEQEARAIFAKAVSFVDDIEKLVKNRRDIGPWMELSRLWACFVFVDLGHWTMDRF